VTLVGCVIVNLRDVGDGSSTWHPFARGGNVRAEILGDLVPQEAVFHPADYKHVAEAHDDPVPPTSTGGSGADGD
jgi:hypothetical protein